MPAKTPAPLSCYARDALLLCAGYNFRGLRLATYRSGGSADLSLEVVSMTGESVVLSLRNDPGLLLQDLRPVLENADPSQPCFIRVETCSFKDSGPFLAQSATHHAFGSTVYSIYAILLNAVHYTGCGSSGQSRLRALCDKYQAALPLGLLDRGSLTRMLHYMHTDPGWVLYFTYLLTSQNSCTALEWLWQDIFVGEEVDTKFLPTLSFPSQGLAPPIVTRRQPEDAAHAADALDHPETGSWGMEF